MMGWNLPDGPDAYLELIRAVDRKAFAVHLDVCNGINSPQRFYTMPISYASASASWGHPLFRVMRRICAGTLK